MFTTDQLNQLSTLLTEAGSILLIFPDKASFDVQATAGALGKSLQALNKDISVISPSEEGLESEIFAANEVRTELGNKTLQVSFPYEAEKVDKVSYNIDDDNQRFYLTIQPQKGHKPLDHHTLEFAYVGAEADLIILVGVNNYDSLEQLYFGYEEMFKDTTVISLNSYETSIGNVKLNSSGMTSLSEAVTSIMRSLQLPVNADSATHLLSGIEEATKNFSSFSATADTFESVAFLMRQGARRVKRQLSGPAPVQLPKVESFGEKVEAAKKKSKAKSGKTITLNEGKVKAAGDLKYQPSESSLGARG